MCRLIDSHDGRKTRQPRGISPHLGCPTGLSFSTRPHCRVSSTGVCRLIDSHEGREADRRPRGISPHLGCPVYQQVLCPRCQRWHGTPLLPPCLAGAASAHASPSHEHSHREQTPAKNNTQCLIRSMGKGGGVFFKFSNTANEV